MVPSLVRVVRLLVLAIKQFLSGADSHSFMYLKTGFESFVHVDRSPLSQADGSLGGGGGGGGGLSPPPPSHPPLLGAFLQRMLKTKEEAERDLSVHGSLSRDPCS